MAINTRFHTGLTSDEHKHISKVRRKLTQPYGHKLRSTEATLALGLIDAAYHQLENRRFSQQDFDEVAFLASQIPGIPVEVLTAHFTLMSVERGLVWVP
jgi:hypothetical protein